VSPGRRGRPGPPEEPTFLVRPTRAVDQRIRAADTPRSVRAAYTDKYIALQARGCAAADYRLSGSGAWPRFCVIDLGAGYKLVLAFQDEQTVVLVHLDQHDQRTDPYAWLEEAFGLPDRSGHGGGRGNRVGCCADDGSPPVDHDLADALASILGSRGGR
jgi:hypothetical protein